MAYKLGSLFDGSGGFPLAGSLCGVEPRWAAEIEPYPIAVTRSRFPNMKHLGDISKIKGGEIEPVDIITFGSPCQDLSVAGKRAGLKHEANGDEETTRSGLFMEAVRIIKEMREATNGEYPSFALWENVPGAFSSNKGEDFRIVCEELIKIVEPTAAMPAVPKNGWPYADSYCGDGWSLAYRVFDAQYWGVPQRRRRIHLVVDFRDQRAREVSFEREGVRGYFETGRTPWQSSASHAQNCLGADGRDGESLGDGRGDGGLDAIAYTLKIRSGCEGGGKGALIQEDKSATLATNNDQYLFQPVEVVAGFCPEQGAKTRGIGWEEEKSPTLRAGVTPALVYWDGNQVCGTLTANNAGGNQRMPDKENFNCVIEKQPVFCLQGAGATSQNSQGMGHKKDTSYTLNTTDVHGVAYALDRATFNKEQTVRDQSAVCCTTGSYMQTTEEVSPTLMARDWKDPTCVCTNYIVRRLTPTECARLQGFADYWGDIDEKETLTSEEFQFWHEVRNTHAAINGKKVMEYTEAQMLTWYNKLHTDSAEYKMWGNGIALPPALYILQGMVDALQTAVADDWML